APGLALPWPGEAPGKAPGGAAARRAPPAFSSLSPAERRRFGLEDSGSDGGPALEAPAAASAPAARVAPPAPASPAWSSLSAEDRRRFGLDEGDAAREAAEDPNDAPEEVHYCRPLRETMALLESERELRRELNKLQESERRLETAKNSRPAV
ncbi:unnamed protein product, partial [Prorocentrum cordatum]